MVSKPNPLATQPREITVIGAGAVGIGCARMLQRDGHRVRVLDPEPPGGGCSFGNAGVFATDSVLPLATPATLAAVLPMLLRGDAPVSLRWRYLPRLLPWLLRFAAQARPARVAANADALTAVCLAAEAGTRELIKGSAVANLVHHTGWISAFETARGLARARAEAAECERRGVACEVLDADATRALVPELGEHIVGATYSPGCWMCTDPAGFVRGLAEDVAAAGGTLARARVHDVHPGRRGIRLDTDAGREEAEHVVIAAGIETPALADRLGEHFPLDTERGYHIMIPQAGIRPPMPIMAGEHKFVTTPMQGGLRLAGLSELGGTRLPPTPRRIRTLCEHGRRLFPDLRIENWSEWMGFRPTLPDSLPVIGRSPADARISYAFGHQHLGLTLAGLTGCLVADDVAGRKPPVDMTPLRPERWL
jgi:glycine/D-amino acid oxidase-like deaminating enzyme